MYGVALPKIVCWCPSRSLLDNPAFGHGQIWEMSGKTWKLKFEDV